MKINKQIISLALATTLALFCGTATAQTYTTLGIGIANPVGTLHVHVPTATLSNPNNSKSEESNYLTSFHMTNAQTGTSNTDGLVIMQTNNAVSINQCENANLSIQNGTGKIVLSPSGKIGIGSVSSGSHLFNVNGTTRITGETTLESNLVINGAMYINNSLYCDNNGNLSVGASAHIGNGFVCDIDGNLKVTHLKVTISDWPDYVFGDNHQLMPLNDVKNYIETNGHLPQMPSALEIENDGADLGEINRILVQKVEELTLYIIDLQQQIEELKTTR